MKINKPFGKPILLVQAIKLLLSYQMIQRTVQQLLFAPPAQHFHQLKEKVGFHNYCVTECYKTRRCMLTEK